MPTRRDQTISRLTKFYADMSPEDWQRETGRSEPGWTEMSDEDLAYELVATLEVEVDRLREDLATLEAEADRDEDDAGEE